jgi:hypothetical protein
MTHSATRSFEELLRETRHFTGFDIVTRNGGPMGDDLVHAVGQVVGKGWIVQRRAALDC